MDTLELFQRLSLALAIGLLIGLERGWRERQDEEGSRTAGLRTFALIGLSGGVWAALTPALGPVPLAAAGVAVIAAFAVFYWRETAVRGENSVTSVVVAALDFALGAYAVLGSQAVAGAAGVATVALLSARGSLHEFVKQVTWPELRSAVLLLTMTFVLLPILPDRTIDPWDTFNPHELWLMTVLIGVVCFVGYAGVRLLGERRGLLLSAAVGALITSTTVTINNSRIARKSGAKENGLLAASICTAWMAGVLRMTTIAVVLNPNLLRPLAPPILGAAFVFASGALVFQIIRSGKDKTESGSIFENPLDLAFVLKFGLLLSAITMVAKFANRSFGGGAVLGLAGLTGFVDVDPITLSVSQLAGMSMTIVDAADAILLAALANMVTKIGAAVTIGGWRFGTPLAAVGIVGIAAAAAARLLIGA